MTDLHLREPERRFRESGSVEDEAAWLRARIQAGELTQDRLDIAAALGHEPSSQHSSYTLPQFVAALFSAWGGFDWGELGLPAPRGWPFGAEVALRSAIGLVRCRVARFAGSPPVENALALLDSRTADRPERTLMRALEELGEFTLAQAGGEPQDCDGWLETLRGLLLDSSVTGIAAAFDWTWGDVETGHLITNELRTGLRAELLPWALGYSDPVLKRVESRQAAARE